MKTLKRCTWVDVVLLMIVCTTQAITVTKEFNRLESGQNFTGKIGAKLKVGSLQECSLR